MEYPNPLQNVLRHFHPPTDNQIHQLYYSRSRSGNPPPQSTPVVWIHQVCLPEVYYSTCTQVVLVTSHHLHASSLSHIYTYTATSCSLTFVPSPANLPYSTPVSL